MSVIGHSALVGAAGNQGGYQISRSLRFRNSASAYLSRTPASNGSQTKWTASFWYKPGRFGSQQPIITSYTSVNNYAIIGFSLNAFYNANDTLKFLIASSGVTQLFFETTAVYRDPSAWYHVVVAVDTTQATSTNRVLIYVNGVQVTSFITATYPALNASLVLLNTTNPQQIGALATGTYGYYDGYMAEFNWIDGQQLSPSSFGEADAVTGVWNPKRYSGTYGTNGFYLNFSDNSAATAAAIGKDSSGNGNNWTPNNISLTAGTTYDSMIDSPTNSASSSNYCVVSPLAYRTTTPTPTISNGNLTVVCPSASASSIGSSTFGVSSGKWYWEVTKTGTSYANVGVALAPFSQTISSIYDFGYASNEYAYVNNGNKYNNNTASAYGATYTNNDIIGVALDLDVGTLTFYKNNASQGTAYSGLSSGTYIVGCYDSYNGSGFEFNFGQRPFSYTPPSGYKALNTYNLPAPSIANGAQYMAATLRSGTAVAGSVSSLSFQPDFIWNKSRSAGVAGFEGHYLMDSIRGGSKPLSSDTTGAEGNNAQIITAFNSNGYSFGTYNGINGSGQTYVDWAWKAGGTGVTNTSGSITSTVSANTTAGFSVATFTTSGGSNPQTIGHGLGVAPSMIIMKSRNNTSGWSVYHSAVGNTGALNLSATTATSTSIDWWQNTSPTSSVWSIGANLNISGWTWVAYCFSAVSGFSAFGKWTGNGSSDGPFVFTNFRPRYVMWKRIDVSGDGWWIVDSSRDTYNVATQLLFAQSSTSETAITTPIDFLSNGFKLRNGADGSINGSGGTYIYMAFAENPFSIARAR